MRFGNHWRFDHLRYVSFDLVLFDDNQRESTCKHKGKISIEKKESNLQTLVVVEAIVVVFVVFYTLFIPTLFVPTRFRPIGFDIINS